VGVRSGERDDVVIRRKRARHVAVVNDEPVNDEPSVLVKKKKGRSRSPNPSGAAS
jgi:hypothetical protein